MAGHDRAELGRGRGQTGGVCRAGLGTMLVLLLAMMLAAAAAEVNVPLSVSNRSNQEMRAAFVCGGVPLAVGLVAEPANVVIVDQAGNVVPALLRALARWPDRSVKWLQVQTTADFAANETKQWRLVGLGDRPVKPLDDPFKTTTVEGEMTVSNGLLSLRLATTGNEFIRGLNVGNQPVLAADGKPQLLLAVDRVGPGNTDEENWLRPAKPDAALVEGTGTLEACYVDELTPLRCVVRCDGGVETADGARIVSFITRYYLYRNSPVLKVEHTVVWDGDPNTNFLRRYALRFPAALTGATVDLGQGGRPVPADGALSVLATKPDVKVHQIPRNAIPPLTCDVYQTAAGQRAKVGPGPQAPGTASIQVGDRKWALAGQRFAQRYPKELTVGVTGVSYEVWPEASGQLLDLRNYRVAHVPAAKEGKRWEGPVAGRAEGLATTERLWFDFGAADGPAIAERTARRLVLVTTAEQYIGSGVFGTIQPYSPDKYPAYEGANDAALAWIARSPDEYQWYGLLNDGANLMEFNWAAVRGWPQVRDTWMCRGYSGWSMDDGGQSWTVLLSFCRSGKLEWFDAAERMMNYVNDMSCIHSESEASQAANNHTRPTIGGSRRHNEQAWGDYVSSRGANAFGKNFFYWLTGEPRYLDVITEGLYFEHLYWSYENWTMVGSLTLGSELFGALKECDPLFAARQTQRLAALDRRAARAKKNNWRNCVGHVGIYKDIETKALANPPELLKRAGQLLREKVNPKQLDFVADAVMAEGVKFYELAYPPAAPEAQTARQFLLTAADAVIAGPPPDQYAPLFQGRTVSLAHAIRPDAKYVKWVQSRLDQTLPQNRLGPLSLKDGMKDGPWKLDYLDHWRRIAGLADSPEKIGHTYGMIVARVPYFLYVLDHLPPPAAEKPAAPAPPVPAK